MIYVIIVVFLFAAADCCNCNDRTDVCIERCDVWKRRVDWPGYGTCYNVTCGVLPSCPVEQRVSFEEFTSWYGVRSSPYRVAAIYLALPHGVKGTDADQVMKRYGMVSSIHGMFNVKACSTNVTIPDSHELIDAFNSTFDVGMGFVSISGADIKAGLPCCTFQYREYMKHARGWGLSFSDFQVLIHRYQYYSRWMWHVPHAVRWDSTRRCHHVTEVWSLTRWVDTLGRPGGLKKGYESVYCDRAYPVNICRPSSYDEPYKQRCPSGDRGCERGRADCP